MGKMPKLHLPSMIVDKRNNELALDDRALSLLVALLSIQSRDARRRNNNRFSLPVHPVAVVEIGIDDLIRITGMSKNTITKGVESLERAGYIRRCRHRVPYTPGAHDEETPRYKQFAVSTYTLLHPETGRALDTRSEESQSLLFANGLHYFSIPACVVAPHPKSKPHPYSFDTMSFPEKRLYIVLIWLARQYNANECDTTGLYLMSLTGLNDRALKKALDGLESRWLMLDTSDDPTIRHIHIALRNPVTRELLSEIRFDPDPRNNACNYYEEYKEGESKRADLLMPPEIGEGLFLQLLQEHGQTAQREGHGEFKFPCPFHNDSTPSCNFNPMKGWFNCFGCHAKGTTHRLLQQLAGGTGEGVIRAVSEAMGKNLEYRDPDWEAIAIYSYRDKFGKLKKQLLRLQDDAEGNRRFSQRRPGKNGWIYTTKGLKPMLFNLDLLENAWTIFMTEGEKDAVTITELGLMAGNHKVIGTTSGNADSWKPILAKDLKHKRVILLPDNDEAGERYSQAIQESLRAEGIEHHLVSFKDTGTKDVTEYLEAHSTEDLVRFIGIDLVRMPDGSYLQDPLSGMVAGAWGRIIQNTEEISY